MKTLVKNKAVDKNQIRAVALLSASKLLSEREAKLQREFLRDGDEHEVSLVLLATVDGIDYREDFEGGRMTIGHATHKAGTVDAGEMIAWILSHIDAGAREAVLEEATQVFEANNCSFPVNKQDYDAVTETLKEMRARNVTQVRGSVSVKFGKLV